MSHHRRTTMARHWSSIGKMYVGKFARVKICLLNSPVTQQAPEDAKGRTELRMSPQHWNRSEARQMINIGRQPNDVCAWQSIQNSLSKQPRKLRKPTKFVIIGLRNTDLNKGTELYAGECLLSLFLGWICGCVRQRANQADDCTAVVGARSLYTGITCMYVYICMYTLNYRNMVNSCLVKHVGVSVYLL